MPWSVGVPWCSIPAWSILHYWHLLVVIYRTPQVWWGTCRHWRQRHCVNSRLEAGCRVCKSSYRRYCCIHCSTPSCRRVPFGKPVAAFHLGQPKVRAATTAYPEMERPWQDQQDLWWLDGRNWLGRGAIVSLPLPSLEVSSWHCKNLVLEELVCCKLNQVMLPRLVSSLLYAWV
jgi:hypothetical protein